MASKADRIHIARAALLGGALVCFAAGAQAVKLDVSVTVTSFTNNDAGNYGRCIDWELFGCGAGDFYPLMSLRGADGVQVSCATPNVIPNSDALAAPAGWTCGTTTALNGVPLQAPVTFVIQVLDFDGRFLAGIDGDGTVDTGDGLGVASAFAVSTPGTTTLTRTGRTATITLAATATPIAPIASFVGAAPTPFDPGLGQKTRVKFSVSDNQANLSATVAAGTPFARSFSQPSFFETERVAVFEWDGLDPTATGRVPVPDGMYAMDFTLNDGVATATAKTDVQVLQTPAKVGLVGLDPANARWWPELGALTAQVLVRQPVSYTVDIHDGPGCTLPSVQKLTGPTVAGPHDVSWNGRLANGNFLSPGRYSVALGENVPGGGSLRRACADFDVVAQPELRVYLETSPPIGFDDDPVTITAFVLDGENRSRPASSITIQTATAAELAARTPPAFPMAPTCTRSAVCSVAAPTGIGTATTMRFGYRVIATDRDLDPQNPPDAARVDTGWLVAHRIASSTATSSAVTGLGLGAGVVQRPFGVFDLARGLDLALRPGDGYDVSTTAGWTDFLAAVQRTRRILFGMPADLRMIDAAASRSNVITTAPDAVSLWVLALPAYVRPGTITSAQGGDRCSVDTYNSGTFDAVGILHQQPCRDNATGLASPSYFTAQSSAVAWHEAHHSLFGLSDEYDGSTGSNTDAPANVYGSLNDCLADPIAQQRTDACTEIAREFKFMQPPKTGSGRYRVDPDALDDVMQANGPVHRDADRRRVVKRINQCRGGGC